MRDILCIKSLPETRVEIVAVEVVLARLKARILFAGDGERGTDTSILVVRGPVAVVAPNWK